MLQCRLCAPRAVIRGPEISSGRRPYLSASKPAGMFISRRAMAYTDRVAPTAAAPTPKLCTPPRDQSDLVALSCPAIRWPDDSHLDAGCRTGAPVATTMAVHLCACALVLVLPCALETVASLHMAQA